MALIAAQAEALARELKVVGLMNIQFAIKGDDLYILEVNPRASRTAPFVSKATGVPLPYMATQVMLGKTLDELDPWSMRRGGFTCVKEAVLPFQRFPGVDIILGPEMHSTGEVMGMGSDFPEAYYKSQLASGQDLPQGGNVFISVNDRDKPILPEVAACSPTWASTCWPRAARPATCANAAWKWKKCSRSMKAVPTSWTA